MPFPRCAQLPTISLCTGSPLRPLRGHLPRFAEEDRAACFRTIANLATRKFLSVLSIYAQPERPEMSGIPANSLGRSSGSQPLEWRHGMIKPHYRRVIVAAGGLLACVAFAINYTAHDGVMQSSGVCQ